MASFLFKSSNKRKYLQLIQFNLFDIEISELCRSIL